MAKEQSADRTAESFQGLLLRHRGRTGLTQRELATRVGVSRGSLQGWEAGLNYPDAQHLRALIVAFLEAGGLTQDASLAGAHLSETVLAEAFNFPVSVVLSGNATCLVAGTVAGEVWLWRVADRTPLLVLRGH